MAEVVPVLSAKRFLWGDSTDARATVVHGNCRYRPSVRIGPLGIIPPPHLLLYYVVFFGYGALYFDTQDSCGQLGRHWWLLLPCGLLLAFPLALLNMGYRPVSVPTQVLYAWTMSFGLMGLFRVVLQKENRAIRYLSDASYWLYLAHLPLIIAAQTFVRFWTWPAVLKFVLISSVATLVLLISYRLFVRYTWIGLVLNRRRQRVRVAQSTC